MVSISRSNDFLIPVEDYSLLLSRKAENEKLHAIGEPRQQVQQT